MNKFTEEEIKNFSEGIKELKQMTIDNEIREKIDRHAESYLKIIAEAYEHHSAYNNAIDIYISKRFPDIEDDSRTQETQRLLLGLHFFLDPMIHKSLKLRGLI
jgi:AICAR transformylase/IMP cyclohydrolase PurH